MDLAAHYNKLYSDSAAKIMAGNYEVDDLIDSDQDFRFGITLVIRPDEQTNQQIQHFLSKVQAVEPNQYYYHNSDLHITLMSIISCYDGFKLGMIEVEDYIKLAELILSRYKRFNIQFKGITASASCILIQGFMTETLNEIRDGLRAGFKNSNLEQSIDRRYSIQTAHATVVRFREKLSNPKALINVLENYRDFDFGTFEVRKIELVYNDWYQRAKSVQKLHTFELNAD